jgi:5-(carboxyamino)imidazole ribonucleotide synthase
MLALAAAELGLSSHIYCPDPKSPAFAVAAARTVAPYEDEAALAAFAAAVDVVTYEFENVPIETARFLAERVTVLPSPRSLEIAQDRYFEKDLMSGLGIPVAGFAEVARQGDIYSALARTGRPAILKTRRFGYDGKGQALIRGGDDPVSAWRAIGEVPAILESFVAFEREVSVIIARDREGRSRAFDVAENVHSGGILVETRVPAALPDHAQEAVIALAARTADALDHVGVLAVEIFVMAAPAGNGEKRFLVNEIAPRVHNSGHWTLDACLSSQFDQHIRAICGWPLGDPTRHSDAVMTNLIGDQIAAWPSLAAEPGASLHIYGKVETLPGRKMGHVTRLKPRADI